ncbi:hypothetical protein AHOG_09825 [Actinoalloteichus hoggarensis]|uniref:Uncharacterized protein n=2 Tax=Actinoalloteichus hoggarensis TaxID=1470176 RepID=A0A221W1J0_9PSEU|nr:hypothetical protein AHOG_09825 [Actinoalloteichus hoggarensis]
MSPLQQVARRSLLAADRAAGARDSLSAAAACLDEALLLTTDALAGATAPGVEHGLMLLHLARETITDETLRLEQAEHVILGFHAALTTGDRPITDPAGGPETRRADTPAAVEQPDRRPSADASPCGRDRPGVASTLGRWQGRTATEHVLDEGRAIGRAPARRKKEPIREVRAVEELDRLFDDLSVNGSDVQLDSYIGRLLRLPDGTTIGYRTKSKTTVEPTIDIKIPGGRSLKIHVNKQTWSI